MSNSDSDSDSDRGEGKDRGIDGASSSEHSDAAVSTCGSGSSKLKRKRVRLGDNNDSDEKTMAVTSPILPDAIQSISRDDDQHASNYSTSHDDAHMVSSLLDQIPDSGYPTTAQLATVLDCLGTLSASQANTNNDFHDSFSSTSTKRSSMARILVKLKSWTGRHEGEPNNNNNNFIRMMTFRKTFLQLGGLARLVFVIEQNMEDVEIVSHAAFMCSACTFRPAPMEDEEWKFVRTAACLAFVQQGGLRMLLLASEEILPSNDATNWNAAVLIWASIRNVVVYLLKIDIDLGQKLLAVVETDFEFMVEEDTQFVEQRLHVIGQYAAIQSLFFTKYEDLAADLMFGPKGPTGLFLRMCQTNASEWLKDANVVHDVLSLCNTCAHCASSQAASSKDVKKWLPLVTQALRVHLDNKKVETLAFQFISRMSSTAYKGEVEKTDLYNTILSIIQSETTPRETKDRYRSLLSKLLA